jgi:hypothetical protein
VEAALPDAIEVAGALRLGWLIAEVRGRALPGGPGLDTASPMARGGWVLPLGSERSPAEREVESGHALSAVARRLEVDPPVTDPPQPAAPQAGRAAPAGGPRFSDEMSHLSRLLADERKQHDPHEETTWRSLARLLYRWDAKIQDSLLSRSDRLANAYELGRALAETYWALDTDAPATVQQDGHDRPNPVSWQFLLGDERRSDIARLLGRLTPYFAPLTPAAVAGSVEVWGAVAASQSWRDASDARPKLLEQVRNWYSLLVAGLDPETMLKPYALLRSWRIFKKTFKAFGLEMVIGLLGAGAIAALGLLIAYEPQQPALKAVSAILGFLGITGAGLQARLKATTQSMVARLSQDLSTDLVAEQITVTPTAPRVVRDKRIRQQAIASRTVTASLRR